MSLKIGDLVRFVDEAIEGHVTSLQSNGIIGVTDDTGFEIPVLKSKVTLVHGNMSVSEDEFERSVVDSNLPFVQKGIFLGIAGEQKDGIAKFFLINQTSYELLLSVSIVSGTRSSGVFANVVAKNDFNQIYMANFVSIGKWPTFQLQIIKHSKQSQPKNLPISRDIRVKPLDLINSKEYVEMMNEKLWLFEIDKVEEDIGLGKLKSHFISHRPKGR